MEILALYYFLFFFLASFLLSKHLFPKTKNLPPSGPISLSIIGQLYLLKKPLPCISAQYGPILLLKFAVEECFTTNDVVFANRSHFLLEKYWGFDYTILSFASYGQHWRNLKRLTNLEIFSFTRVRLLLWRLFEGAAKASKIVEMKSIFFEVTLNNMMMMITGKRYYGDDDNVDKTRQFQELVEEMFTVAGASNVADFLPLLPLLRWVGFNGLEKKLVSLQGKRDYQFMLELIKEYRMARTESKDEKPLIDVLLSAGTDTIAGTMEWAMTLLLNHPEVLKKAQTEIDAIVGQGRLINESDTFRMYLAAPLLIPHESSEECTVGGFKIQRGTKLLVNMWVIQNDPKMEGMGGVRDGYKLMPFGSGRRGYPSEGLALRVVSLTLASLIQCFEWERVDEELIDMTKALDSPCLKLSPWKLSASHVQPC
ncbi:hypothetical protein NE237_032083 [Protea cynaroides]|uniref:Cytochrome P450 n=1 Tax=Protea cynaroides TaxID=273540 RepID=A0A9Q0L3P8_9MAGN|nr:hypothetical protein NE237_032083 [Protea cynaroides]